MIFVQVNLWTELSQTHSTVLCFDCIWLTISVKYSLGVSLTFLAGRATGLYSGKLL